MKSLKAAVLAAIIASTRLNLDISDMMFNIRDNPLYRLNGNFEMPAEVKDQEQFYRMKGGRYMLNSQYNPENTIMMAVTVKF